MLVIEFEQKLSLILQENERLNSLLKLKIDENEVFKVNNHKLSF